MAVRGRFAAPAEVEATPFRKLADAVVIPLVDLQAPGSEVLFKAWIVEPSTPAGELLLRGTILRLESGSLDAFCLTCPHEICEVERVVDTGRLPQEDGALPEHPLLACPCHFSVFDPEDGGALLAGPAPRGLYRFGFDIVGEQVRIDRIEAALVDRFTIR